MADRGHKNVITIAWKYSFGEESVSAFTEGFTKAGGKSARNCGYRSRT